MPFTRSDEQIPAQRQLFSRHTFSGLVDTAVDETTETIGAVKRIHRVLVTFSDNADPDLGTVSAPLAGVAIDVDVINPEGTGDVAFTRPIEALSVVTAAQTEIIFDPGEWLRAGDGVQVRVGAGGAARFAHVIVDYVNF